MTYPIRYAKGERRQWAGTPAQAVALEFDGWMRETPEPEPPTEAAAEPSGEPEVPRRTKRNNTGQS